MSGIFGFAFERDKSRAKALLAKMPVLLAHRGPLGIRQIKLRDAGLGSVESRSFLESHGSAESPSKRSARADSATAARGEADVSVVLDGYLINRPALLADLGLSNRETDVELVAAGFRRDGAGFFAKLDGAFALALAAAGTIYLVRDGLGEKPLYFTRINGALLFASEIKAFFAHPAFHAEANPASLLQLLVFSFIPNAPTMFRGVSEVLPGTLQVETETESRSQRHWDLEETHEDLGEAYYRQAVQVALERAVASRLPAGAKPAVFLSGGVDSSAVAANLATKTSPLAISVGFGEGMPNELRYAQAVAQRATIRHEVLHVHPDGFVALLPKIIWTLDDPLCDCITVPNYLLAEAAAKSGCNIVFNGEGGDPLFGGPKNKFMILREWYAHLQADQDRSEGRARAYLGSYHKFYDHLRDACTPGFLKQAGGDPALIAVAKPFLSSGSQKHFLNRLMYVNIKLKGGQNILVKVDKMLSAHGMRVASPLFDQKLTELTFRIPPKYKRRGDIEKYIFKKAVEHTLPKTVVYRKKAGMGVPLNAWFRNTRLRDYAGDLLLSPRSRQRGIFQPKFVQTLLDGRMPTHAIGQDRSGELLWMMLAIELWHRVFVEGERP
jgi:asparagine synthase (glutamine-hydrolysing)